MRRQESAQLLLMVPNNLKAIPMRAHEGLRKPIEYEGIVYVDDRRPGTVI